MQPQPRIQTQVSSGLYAFSKLGGAVGTFQLTNPVIPANAVILRAWYDVLEAPTSGGAATIALGLTAAATNTLAAATVIGGAEYTAGAHTTVVGPPAALGTALTKTTAAGHISLTVAVATLTAGQVLVSVEYYIGD